MATRADTSIGTYKARRDFTATPEPAPSPKPHKARGEAIFVVQKHDATRLHWDFRLEYGGVLWSWAVPKGPSLDPSHKRLAVRTEDHPLDYADFAGTIPKGHYGAGTVETWDRGTWTPILKDDPQTSLDKGELKFTLDGDRLKGGFVLVRLKPRPKDRSENWLLIKEHDLEEEAGGDAEALEKSIPAPKPSSPRRRAAAAKAVDIEPADAKPPQPAALKIPGARRAAFPDTLAPQLASSVEAPPDGDWLSEVKFDGYRLLAFKRGREVRLMTRNGHDWTKRLPTIARAVGRLDVPDAVLDGELVALREDGRSSFALLQQALSDSDDKSLIYYLFDLPYSGGQDLRGAALVDRKTALQSLSDWRGALRYSDHQVGKAAEMRQQACEMGLEGIICKQQDAPYRSGRGRSWVKVKCSGREEFVVLGYTPPAGARSGLGALHLGYHDPDGALQYVGGVGTGFTDKELGALRKRLEDLKAQPPERLVYAGEPPDRTIRWTRPDLVAEVQFASWSGGGRIRHATYLGLREDKPAADVIRPIADAEMKRVAFSLPSGSRIIRAAAPKARTAAARRDGSAETPPRRRPASDAGDDTGTLDGVKITHAGRELWPGITKLDLATYWSRIPTHALAAIAHRPLALVRCPEGIDGERFFQKHAKPGFPAQIRGGEIDGAPYLALDDLAGLIACAQVSAIEIHSWGATEEDGTHPDRVVFDLDPGEDLAFSDVVRGALDVRERLTAAGLESFCRTSGGKGLHVVAPLRARADWDTTRAWCRAFAETMAADQPDTYVSRVAKVERHGRILVDWLRNGLGSTAIASFSPRARPGATVATPLAWKEVTATLDPSAFTIQTIPDRLAAQKSDPWRGFAEIEQSLPDTMAKPPSGSKRKT